MTSTNGAPDVSYYDQNATSAVGLGDIRNRKPKPFYKDPDAPPLYDSRGEYYKRKTSWTMLGLSLRDVQMLVMLILIAIFVRLYRISEPTSVVFDEVHFGGFASKYIKGRFFMDVHPPLAKLLITLAGVIGGFDGNFDFKEIGKDYIEPGVPYVIMRLTPGILGILVIPIAYLTIKLAGFSTISALLVALLLTFENGLITQSRHILLDSPLLAFTAFTVLTWVNFHNRRPFTYWWWFWLAMTGVGLGLTVSVKWVGLFTIALIGLSTINGLWELLGDLRINPKLWTRHFIARVLCLILIPVTIYMFMFMLHFAILRNSGDGDGFMSSEFQQTLGGHGMADTPIDIAYDSTVSIRHIHTQGGYLHSHSHSYPGGSKQQQITLYPHKDENNLWIIRNRTSSGEPSEEMDPMWVLDGAVIRLEHASTKKKLHSHDVRPPITDVDYQNEVSGYGGHPGFDGDDNDLWRVQIAEYDTSDPEAENRLRTLHSQFQLIHVTTGCYLFSHSVKLPEWGFDQQEVTCVKGGTYPRSLWYIETNSHPNLPPDTETVNYKKPGFFGKFFELQKVMWKTNAGLTDSHPYESRPLSWIFLKRGISFWGKENRHIYLLGNPIIWWSSTAALFLFATAKVFFIFHHKATKEFYESHAGFFFLGWFLHWFPFFLMSRQLFLHHYFPALYFAVLLFGVTFDLFTLPFSVRKRAWAALTILIISLYVFRLFSPISYATPWTKDDCNEVKWLSTWDFDCNQFHDTYAEYDTKSRSAEVVPSESPNSSVVVDTTSKQDEQYQAIEMVTETTQGNNSSDTSETQNEQPEWDEDEEN